MGCFNLTGVETLEVFQNAAMAIMETVKVLEFVKFYSMHVMREKYK